MQLLNMSMDRLTCIASDNGPEPLHVFVTILVLGGTLLIGGRASGFLQPERIHGLQGSKAHALWCLLSVSARVLLFPSLAEEVAWRFLPLLTIFIQLFWRFLLLPSASEHSILRHFFIQALVLVGYVLSHPLCGILLEKALKQGGYTETFSDSRFLLLTTLLGTYCAFLYCWTGCLWPSVVMHWLSVWAWLLFFGGERQVL